MSGYNYSQQLHTNFNMTANLEYTFILNDFRIATYFFMIDGAVVGNGAVNIVVSVDSLGGNNRILFSRSMRTALIVEAITIVLPTPIIFVVVNKGALTSLNVTDSIYATG